MNKGRIRSLAMPEDDEMGWQTCTECNGRMPHCRFRRPSSDAFVASSRLPVTVRYAPHTDLASNLGADVTSVHASKVTEGLSQIAREGYRKRREESCDARGASGDERHSNLHEGAETPRQKRRPLPHYRNGTSSPLSYRLRYGGYCH